MEWGSRNKSREALERSRKLRSHLSLSERNCWEAVRKKRSAGTSPPPTLSSCVRHNPSGPHEEGAFSVVLASASPRRIELLKSLIPNFEVVPADILEEDHVHDDPWVTAQRTAREKALAVAARRPKALVIAGDTVVALRGAGFQPARDEDSNAMSAGRMPAPQGWIQLAKPADEADACRMLGLLQGRAHTVVTGVCLVWPGGFSAFTEATQVTFKRMSDAEVAAYVATGEPMDKAGAYGFQGGARPFVERVEGSATNVIGLPMEKLREALTECVGLTALSPGAERE
ncbi:MAG: Maf family protein [Chthonomonadaceae bacterium]|nr:Maf family protein [Chthonomonadaceae bacterium]